MYDSHDISAYIARLKSERKQKAQEALHESNTIQSQKTDVDTSIANTSPPQKKIYSFIKGGKEKTEQSAFE